MICAQEVHIHSKSDKIFILRSLPKIVLLHYMKEHGLWFPMCSNKTHLTEDILISVV